VNNLKKYSADLERTLITTPLIRRNKNGTVVLQESVLKSRIKKLETLIEKALTPPTMGKKIENLTTDMVWDNDYGTLNDIVIIRKINEIINHINKEEEDDEKN